MVYMPGAMKGKAWKLARPFYGPYRVLATTPTNLEVNPVDKPDAESIFISLNRIRPCYPELPDISWCGDRVQTPHEIFYEVLSVATSERMQKLPAA